LGDRAACREETVRNREGYIGKNGRGGKGHSNLNLFRGRGHK